MKTTDRFARPAKLVSFGFLLAACVWLAGCSHDSHVTSGRKCYVTSYNSSSTDGYQMVRTVTYNSSLQELTETYSYAGPNWTFNYTFNYEYNSQGKVSQIITTGDSPGKALFSYDPAGKWVEEDHYTSSNELDYKQILDFNNSGQVIKSSFYDGVSLSQYFTYEYPNSSDQNYTRIKYFDAAGTLQETTDYEYDSKNAPTSSVSFISATHNVTKSTTKDNLGAVTYTVSTVYEYNSDDFPTKGTSTSTGSSNSTSTALFQYTCR